MKLFINALTKFILGIIMVSILVFLPAGTLHYAGAWRFMGLLFAPMLIFGAILFLKAPELLEKRLNAKEKVNTQRSVVKLIGLIFMGVFILAGLDFRFAWTTVPGWLIFIASLVLLGSYLMYMEVMRENAYLSRTVEIQKGQTVIDTGLYGIIRHPMYTASILLFLSVPLVLGSWIAFVVMLIFPALIIMRIHSEEKVLREGLEGYDAYTKKVRYRLIPYIW